MALDRTYSKRFVIKLAFAVSRNLLSPLASYYTVPSDLDSLVPESSERLLAKEAEDLAVGEHAQRREDDERH
jgi:hypothetical protein